MRFVHQADVVHLGAGRRLQTKCWQCCVNVHLSPAISLHKQCLYNEVRECAENASMPTYVRKFDFSGCNANAETVSFSRTKIGDEFHWRHRLHTKKTCIWHRTIYWHVIIIVINLLAWNGLCSECSLIRSSKSLPTRYHYCAMRRSCIPSDAFLFVMF